MIKNNFYMDTENYKMKISIFIGVHKWIKFFEYCLDSIIQQTYENWELVILDNSKELNIEQLIEKYFEEKSYKNLYTQKIKVYKSLTDNHNIGYVKGIAAKLCTGDILCEMDYDDILLPNALECLKQAAEKTDCNYFYSDWINLDWYEKGHVMSRHGELVVDTATIDYPDIGKINVNVFGLKDLRYEGMRHKNYFPLHIRAWRRDFFHLIDGYDSSLPVVDDNDIQIKSIIYGKVCRVCYPACVCNYHNQNSTNTFDIDYIYNLVEEIFKKYDLQLSERYSQLKSGEPLVTTFIPTI